jgi:hypothetical protein
MPISPEGIAAACLEKVRASKLASRADRAAVADAVSSFVEQRRAAGDNRSAVDLHIAATEHHLAQNRARRMEILDKAGIQIPDTANKPTEDATTSEGDPMTDKWNTLTPKERWDAIAPFYPFEAASGSETLRRIARSNVDQLKEGEWARIRGHIANDQAGTAEAGAVESGNPDISKAPLATGEGISGGTEPGQQSPDFNGETQITHAAIDAARETRDLGPIEKLAKSDFGENWDEAKSIVAQDRNAGRRLAEEIAANPRPVDDRDVALLLHNNVEAKLEFDRATEALNAKAGDPDLIARQEQAEKDYTTAQEAIKHGASKTGKGLRALQQIANDDYSLVSLRARFRAKANQGRPLSEKQSAQIAKLHAQLEASNKRLAVYEAHKSRRNQPSGRAIRQQLVKQGRTIEDFYDSLGKPGVKFARQESRLSIRPSERYGFLITGRNAKGNSIRISAKSRAIAEHIRDKVARGEQTTIADFAERPESPQLQRTIDENTGQPIASTMTPAKLLSRLKTKVRIWRSPPLPENSLRKRIEAVQLSEEEMRARASRKLISKGIHICWTNHPSKRLASSPDAPESR